MIYSTRFRLITSFLGVCLLVGGLSLVIGVRLLHQSTLNEAHNRIRLDLNTARTIYEHAESRMLLAVSIAAEEPVFRESVRQRDIDSLQLCIDTIAGQTGMDFAGIVLTDGETAVRLEGGDISGPSHPAALECLTSRETVSGTVVLDQPTLMAEGAVLADTAQIDLVKTPMAAQVDFARETRGMTITAAAPIFLDGRLLGALYGGIVLNRDQEIVDEVRETVFTEELFHGRNIGTVTIFLDDLRVSTNVVDESGKRAIGTRVSKEVRQRVLIDGARWTDRAFVVNDWYITAYEPVTDISGNRVGMLYVGVLEAKYVEIRRESILLFVLVTIAGMLIAVVLGAILAQRILDPVQRLIVSSRKVSEGDLAPDIGRVSRSEIGVLQRTFAEMLTSLRERDQHQRAESERKLLQSEKQASIGRLAAGVAHEINNPLTGVVTFTQLLLQREDLAEDIRADLQVVADSTERVRKIVKGLLDFSRQSILDPVPTDVNELIESTIPLVANQALLKGVIFCFDPGDDIPERTLDQSLFQSVILNMILNAIDATDNGGHITIETRLILSAGVEEQRGIEISIEDTGRGIDPEHLDKLFDPFFTTKEVGEGTGLGLSVSQGVVERHGGTIRVQSTPGKGSRFTVWLPVDRVVEP